MTQVIKVLLREKARRPWPAAGDEWPLGVWGQKPPMAFSLGRSSDLWSEFFTHSNYFKKFVSQNGFLNKLSGK